MQSPLRPAPLIPPNTRDTFPSFLIRNKPVSAVGVPGCPLPPTT